MKASAVVAGKRKHARKSTSKSAARRKTTKPERTASPAASNARIEDALNSWRLREARRRGVPAFRIFSDKVLKAIATSRPATARELLSIPGIGMATVENYGAQIYRIVHDDGS